MLSADDPLISLLRQRGEHTSIPLEEFNALVLALFPDDTTRAAARTRAESYRGLGDMVLATSKSYIHDGGPSRSELRVHLIPAEEALERDAEIIKALGTTDWNGIPRSIKGDEYRFWGFWSARPATFSVDGALGNTVRERSGYGQSFRLDEPETWNTWTELATARVAGITTLVTGPAIALDRQSNVIVIDLDPVERNIPKNLKPEFHEWYLKRSQFQFDKIVDWGKSVGAFIETSRSGRGTHIIFKCSAPPAVPAKFALTCTANIATIDGIDHQLTVDGRYPDTGGFGHILLAGSHVFLTGRKQHGSGDDVPVVSLAEFDRLVKTLTANLVCSPVANVSFFGSASASIEITGTFGRHIDLSDAQALAKLPRVNKSSAAALNSHFTHGDFSEIIRNVTGDLDKVTGDPDQLLRIIMQSQLMRTAGTDKNGRNRQEKFLKQYWRAHLPKCRGRNNTLLAHREAARAEAARLSHYFGWNCELKRMPNGAMALLPIYSGDRAEFILNAYASKYHGNTTPAPTTAKLLAWREAPAPDWLAVKINELLNDPAKFLALYNDYYEGPLP